MFKKIVVLKNFPKFTEKHLCRRPSFNKAAGLQPGIQLRNSLQPRYFHVDFGWIFVKKETPAHIFSCKTLRTSLNYCLFVLIQNDIEKILFKKIVFHIYIYIYIYGIHHWRILWSSYRKYIYMYIYLYVCTNFVCLFLKCLR